MVTFRSVRDNPEVACLLKTADRQLRVLGFTEHSFRHVGLTARNAGRIMAGLNYPAREIELARITGYLHDIGNAVNREDHAHTGAVLAYEILLRMGMKTEEAAEIMLAIGQHDEITGTAVSPISAAVILGDKADVHRSRVYNRDINTFDIHDRVNYAVESSRINLSSENKTATLELTIDTSISPVMDYFEIFLYRMNMCKRAAGFLGLAFHLTVNETKLL